MKLSNNLTLGCLRIPQRQSSNIFFKNVTNININNHNTKVGIDFSLSNKIHFNNNDLSRKIREAQEAISVTQTSDEVTTKITDTLNNLKGQLSKIPNDTESDRKINPDELAKFKKCTGDIDKLANENKLNIKNILKDDTSAIITSKTTSVDNLVNMKYKLEGEGAETVVKAVSSINNSCVSPNVAFSGGCGALVVEPATYTIRGNTGTVSVGGSLVINGEEIKLTDNYSMPKLSEYINNNKEKFGVSAELLESYGVKDTNLKLTALGQPGADSQLTVEYKNGIHPEGPQAGKLQDAIVYGKTTMSSGVTELAKPATYIVRGNTGTVSIGGTLEINGQAIKLPNNYPMTKLAEYINNNSEIFGVSAELLESYGVKDTNLKLTTLGEAGPNSKLSIKYKDGIHPEGPHAGKLHDTVVYGSDLTITPGEGFLIDGKASKEGDFIVKGNTVTITKEGNSKGLIIEFSKAGSDIQHGVAIAGVSYEHHTTTTKDLNITIGSKSLEQYNIEVKDMSSKAFGLDDLGLKELSGNNFNVSGALSRIDDAIKKLENNHNYFVSKNNEISGNLNSLLKESNQKSHQDFELNIGISIEHDNNLFAGMLLQIKDVLFGNCHSNMMAQCNSIDKNSVLKLLR